MAWPHHVAHEATILEARHRETAIADDRVGIREVIAVDHLEPVLVVHDVVVGSDEDSAAGLHLVREEKKDETNDTGNHHPEKPFEKFSTPAGSFTPGKNNCMINTRYACMGVPTVLIYFV